MKDYPMQTQNGPDPHKIWTKYKFKEAFGRGQSAFLPYLNRYRIGLPMYSFIQKGKKI